MLEDLNFLSENLEKKYKNLYANFLSYSSIYLGIKGSLRQGSFQQSRALAPFQT